MAKTDTLNKTTAAAADIKDKATDAAQNTYASAKDLAQSTYSNVKDVAQSAYSNVQDGLQDNAKKAAAVAAAGLSLGQILSKKGSTQTQKNISNLQDNAQSVLGNVSDTASSSTNVAQAILAKNSEKSPKESTEGAEEPEEGPGNRHGQCWIWSGRNARPSQQRYKEGKQEPRKGSIKRAGFERISARSVCKLPAPQESGEDGIALGPRNWPACSTSIHPLNWSRDAPTPRQPVAAVSLVLRSVKFCSRA